MTEITEVNTHGHYLTANVPYYIYEITPLPNSRKECTKLLQEHKHLINDLKQQLELAEVEQKLIKLDCETNGSIYEQSYEYEQFLNWKRQLINKRRNTYQSINVLEEWLSHSYDKEEKLLKDKYLTSLQGLWEKQRSMEQKFNTKINRVMRLLKQLNVEIEVEKSE